MIAPLSKGFRGRGGDPGVGVIILGFDFLQKFLSGLTLLTFRLVLFIEQALVPKPMASDVLISTSHDQQIETGGSGTMLNKKTLL